MKIGIFLAFLLTTTTSICCAQGVPANTANVPQSRIDALISSLKSNGVERVEILQIPPGVLTRALITPDMQERTFDYKLFIRDLRGGAYSASLLAGVTSTFAQPAAEMGDLRWGMIFFGADEARIASIYFDASGHRGVVDSLAVSFKGDLSKWLDTNFSKAFK